MTWLKSLAIMDQEHLKSITLFHSIISLTKYSSALSVILILDHIYNLKSISFFTRIKISNSVFLLLSIFSASIWQVWQMYRWLTAGPPPYLKHEDFNNYDNPEESWCSVLENLSPTFSEWLNPWLKNKSSQTLSVILKLL